MTGKLVAVVFALVLISSADAARQPLLAGIPAAPLNGRLHPIVAWTGKALLVWGGDPIREQIPGVEDWWPFLDGAVFTLGRP